MNFNVKLEIKTSQGEETTLNFKPFDNTICDCDAIIVKVPITAQGYFVGKEYIVTIAPFVVETVEETVA